MPHSSSAFYFLDGDSSNHCSALNVKLTLKCQGLDALTCCNIPSEMLYLGVSRVIGALQMSRRKQVGSCVLSRKRLANVRERKRRLSCVVQCI